MAKSILALILQFLVGQVLGKLSISGTREVSDERDEMSIAESKNQSHGSCCSDQKNSCWQALPEQKPDDIPEGLPNGRTQACSFVFLSHHPSQKQVKIKAWMVLWQLCPVMMVQLQDLCA